MTKVTKQSKLYIKSILFQLKFQCRFLWRWFMGFEKKLKTF